MTQPCIREVSPEQLTAIASIPDQSLDEALAMIAGRFDIASILDRSYRLNDVAEYYRQSDRGYKLFHSREGALHIALGGDGRRDTGCYARQADIFVGQMDAIGAERVIEFGCGMGYNARRVATRCPSLKVLGVDLTESHVQTADKACRHLPNARFEIGNYESLPHAAGSLDGILAVETLCQTDSQENALREAARLLRPGGRLVAIDCFRRAPLEGLPTELWQAAQLVEKTTAVDAFRGVEEWIRIAQEAGLKLVECIDHSAETEQNLARLYGLARRYFKLSLVARALANAFPPLLLENAVCGLLMPYTVGLGAHAYCTIIVEK
jgi:ubiquinone/menaquinone biosynthesis C-methylase UbiE